ncbi:hypothetical protein CRENBAI_016112 [Crenichthys baileyi]|uniref:Uncharacterized protein n=1 Tax=Crenichthys baileyi TaxID=28760 RepID=A0AAV9R7G2_9TELE
MEQVVIRKRGINKKLRTALKSSFCEMSEEVSLTPLLTSAVPPPWRLGAASWVLSQSSISSALFNICEAALLGLLAI